MTIPDPATLGGPVASDVSEATAPPEPGGTPDGDTPARAPHEAGDATKQEATVVADTSVARLTPDGPRGMLFAGMDLRAFGRRMGQVSS